MKIAKVKNYKLLISPSNAHEHMTDETDGFSFLTSGLADGAVIMDNILVDQRIDYLMKNKIPHVILGNCSNYQKSHWIDLNNYNAGYMGGKFLVEKGYKDIIFLIGDQEFKVSQERARGFEVAMNDLDCKSFNIKYGVSTTIKAYETVVAQLDAGEKPRAYFVSGDERAIGVYRAIQEKGMKIPEDIAVLGIDNIPIGNYLFPSLSSIHQPAELFAKQVLGMLVKLIEGGTEDSIENQLLAYKIIEREST